MPRWTLLTAWIRNVYRLLSGKRHLEQELDDELLAYRQLLLLRKSSQILDLREQSQLFEDFAAIQSLSMQLTGEGTPEQLQGGIVTSNFFSVLGVDPVLGRHFPAR